jgi:adenylate cyclase
MTLFQFEREILNSGLSSTTKKALTYPSYFENFFYDHRMNVVLDEEFREDKIILAAIDEKSLKKFGRFPWSRNSWVPILNKLKSFGAKVVVFDVVFSEKERFFDGESPDIRFARAIKDFQSIEGNHVIIPFSLSSMHSNDDDVSFKELPGDLFNFMLEVKQDGEQGLEQHRVMFTTYPIEEVISSEAALAYIDIKEDPDGIYRKYPLVTNVESLYFNSLALMAYTKYTEDTPKLSINLSGDAELSINTGTLHLNYNGETRVNWAGRTNAFPKISLATVVEKEDTDEKMKKLFDGKVVFIGSTAFGAHDLRHSPIDPQLPGVYYHMNVLQMLTSGRLFKPINDAFLWSWAILLIGYIGFVLISTLKNAVLDASYIGFYCSAVFLTDVFYFIPNGYEIAMFFAFFPVILAYILDSAISFYLANKDRAFLKQAFGNYISPELIDMMYDSGNLPELGGESGNLTAYFTDIQSFSTFSEKLTAKQLVELLNEYLTEMTDILLEEHGTLDKYEGDAIIAFFGAPVYFDDHAARACRVAIKMQESLGVLREKWISEGDKWPEVVKLMRMRIGINSGEIVTGNMGSRDRMNYTMMGDSVNLAARLEEAAKQYGIYTYISEVTKDMAGEAFLTREIDTIRVVGKSEPVVTYELIGIKENLNQDIINLKERFEEALKLYKTQKWNEALNIFKELDPEEERCFPGINRKTNPSKIYIERCLAFKEDPPGEDWDGVYTLTTK